MTTVNDQCMQIMQQRLAMMDGIVREVMERSINTKVSVTITTTIIIIM